MKLTRAFYLNTDVVEVARSLLGKYLYTNMNACITAGVITETEAYNGREDKACHAYGGRLTERTRVMFQQGGTAYVYLCYGIHSLFNVVTNTENNPQAVLIRGVYPVLGLETILKRVKKDRLSGSLTDGPGKLSKALGIHYTHSGLNLLGDQIWIEDKNLIIQDDDVLITSRIGVDYAEEDAALPYRFMVKDTKVQDIKKALL